MRRRARYALGVCAAAAVAVTAPGLATAETVSVVADHLNNPRSIAIGADGAVYVAEAGKAGPICTGKGEETICVSPSSSVTQVVGGIVKRVVTGLVSGGGRDGTFTTGADGVSVTPNGTIYLAMTGGDQCQPTTQFGALANAQLGRLLKAKVGGKARAVANISTIECTGNPDGTDRNSNPYAVLALGGNHEIVVDAGGNTLIDVQGRTAKLLAIFPRQKKQQYVPTSIALGPDGAYYVGGLDEGGGKGKARVFRVVPGAKPAVYATGFTNITGLAFGPDGSLYATQLTRNGLASQKPGASVIRLAPDGTRTELGLGKLFFAAGAAVDATGAVYVSNWSVLPGATQKGGPFKGNNGQLVKITP